jgi:UDP:flavonoid glycosyltransferase YjiC (YdhE family)
MRIVLGSAGSRGDVLPILEVAAELQRRGHAVHVFAPRYFEAEARGRGLETSFFSTESQELMRSLGPGLRSAPQVLAWAERAMREQFEALLPATEGADALVTMVNELGAPTIAEHRRIPHFRVCCVPCLVGDQPPAVQPLQRLPGPMSRLLWAGVELGTRLVFGRALNRRRRELGLAPVRRFSDYAAGTSRNLLAMDPVLVPPGRGWRHAYEYVGYPFGGDDGLLSPELESFLAAGPPPVYLGFGSVCLPRPERTTRIVLEAVGRVGCRAILGAGWTGLGDGARLPGGILQVRDAPHRALFPRMAALVHHGGSGTTHSAARAGVPQVVVPHMLDQFYWGERVRHLGLGPGPVPHAELTIARLVRLLRELIRPSYRHQARVVAGLMRTDGVRAIADAVEGWATSRVAPRSGAGARPSGEPCPVRGEARGLVRTTP